MSNRKLFRGIVIGAVVGGLVTLLDRETRTYTLEKLKDTQSKTSYYVKNPSVAIHGLRENYQQFSEQLVSGVNSTIQMLGQLQEILDSVNQTEEQQEKKIIE